MATAVPVPLGRGLASFSMAGPCDVALLLASWQQKLYLLRSRSGVTGNGLGSIAAVFVLSGCAGELSALDPAGPAARSIAHIWHIMAWSSAAILIFMVLLAAYACVRQPRHRETSRAGLFLLGGGVIFPGTILLVLLIYGLRSGDAQSPMRNDKNIYRIEVRAHQWWWEVRYPDVKADFLMTRNEIHVPAGRPLYISVTTQDVIHSFWIPRLGGKIDAIPGRVNTIRLVADEPGTYAGACAEFCGSGHAAMPFQLIAYNEDDLDAALDSLRAETDTRALSGLHDTFSTGSGQ